MLIFDVYRTILEDKKIPCVLICTHKKHKGGQDIEAKVCMVEQGLSQTWIQSFALHYGEHCQVP